MATFVDTHCHLHFNSFTSDLDLVIDRAATAGVNRILVPGIDLLTSRHAVELSEQYQQIYCAVGLHPNEVVSAQPGWKSELAELAAHPKVVAIGEIGLDFFRSYCPEAQQVGVLSEQLDLGLSLGKPVILHSRQSMGLLLQIICDWQKNISNEHLRTFPGVLHAFEGDVEQAAFAHQHHFLIGVGGPVTYKNALDKHNIVRQAPLNQILLETDAPFLTPHPYRGQRNEPARILEIAEKIAELKSVNINEIAERTSLTAYQLFGWS